MTNTSHWGVSGEPEQAPEPVRQDVDLTADPHDPSRGSPFDTQFSGTAGAARRQRITRAGRRALRRVRPLQPEEGDPIDLTIDPVNATPAGDSRARIFRRDLDQPDHDSELSLTVRLLNNIEVALRIAGAAMSRPLGFAIVLASSVCAVIALFSSSPTVENPAVQVGLYLLVVIGVFGALLLIGLRFVDRHQPPPSDPDGEQQ